MIFSQRSPSDLGPVPTVTPVTVVDVPASTADITHAGVVFERSTTSATHVEFELGGVRMDGTSLSYSSAPVDDTAYPTLRPVSNGLFQVRVTDGRWETETLWLNFTSPAPVTTYSNPKDLVDGTYAKYSWDRVHALFSALDDGTPENHRVFDVDQLRRAVGIIPHESLTCHAAGAGGSINAAGGHLRTVAVTRRHCIQISHSGSGGATGWQIRFRGVDNSIVTRTVVSQVNVGYDWGITRPPGFTGPTDVRLYVLDSDLPESITPAPYVGDWFFNYTGTKLESVSSPGAFGFASFNQDTHISPVQVATVFPETHSSIASWTIAGVLLEGTDFGIRYTDDFRRPMQDAFYPRSVELEGFERWRRYESFNVLDDTWYPDKPFRHRTRPGDSGSPVFWPIADGKWAIGHEMISGNIWRPAAINALIAHANASLGITEEYTVTVAPDPLATSPSVPTNAFRDGGNNPVVDAAGAYLCPA